MSAEIYAVLQPVHHLLAQVTSAFVARKIARDVGRQLREGTTPERLQHRLTTRFASTLLSEIRDPGRWLLGVALPRWGCGYVDCESGTIWRTSIACEVCAELVQDKAAARERDRRLAEGLCREHSTQLGWNGHCIDCDLDAVAEQRAAVSLPVPNSLPRGTCLECGVWIHMTGHALTDSLCKPCRADTHATTVPPPRAEGAAQGSVPRAAVVATAPAGERPEGLLGQRRGTTPLNAGGSGQHDSGPAPRRASGTGEIGNPPSA